MFAVKSEILKKLLSDPEWLRRLEMLKQCVRLKWFCGCLPLRKAGK